MDFDDQLRRYFGTTDLATLPAEALAAGIERMRVDLGLETDRSRRFALWALMHMLGAAPDLDVAFKDEADREAARNFMDLAADENGDSYFHARQGEDIDRRQESNCPLAESRMKIIGSYVSPYVRKVVACLALKGIQYEIDPITPFFGDEEFGRLSPLRRIPVLVHGDLAICDSTVICAWLDEAFPEHPLLPASPADRARARWLEEYADTRMGDVFIWGLFYPKRVHPAVWGEPGDAARIEKTLGEDAPAVLDYLEGELPAQGFLFGEIGLADIAIASFFRNAFYVDFAIDPARWPRTAAFVARALGHPCIADLLPFEQAQLGTDPAGRRAALIAAGAPLTAGTVGTRQPQKGIMTL